MSVMSPDELEQEVLVNRYLYYVYNYTLLSDHEYDQLERKARAVLPETSVVHGIGSSNESSYSATVIKIAKKRANARKREIKEYQQYLKDQEKINK